MKRVIITLAAVATIVTASAQGVITDQQWGGLLMDKDILMPADMLELSQTQFNFGTARAMAMAGAFTSLGADLSSMSINPAGLGMYRRSDVSITPLLSVSKSSTDAAPYGSNSRTRFGLSNFGIVIHAYEGTGALTSLNVGFGYNRLSDLNYRQTSQRQGQDATIADAFARQLVWGGVSKNDFYNNGGSGSWNWDNIAPEYWNNALAYRAFMIDQVNPNDPGSWQPTWIGQNADIGHYSAVESSGSVGEFNLSLGMNLGNKFYIGGSLGILTLHQEKYINYSEDYVYEEASVANPEFGTDPNLDYQLLYAKMNQGVVIDGTGVNFKLGFIYRPIPGLRIGAAIHTPTYYAIDRSFQTAAAGMAYANRNTDPNVHPDANGYISTDGDPNMVSPTLKDAGPDGWSFSSPTRLMFGLSYAFGERALISVDYERDWYNGIRIKDNPGGVPSRSYNDTFREYFKGSNTIRVGAEFKPLPMLALRAGFGYNGGMLKNKDKILASPIVKQTTYYSAGLGFSFSPSVYLDVAYQYMNSKMSDYYLFYVEEKIDDVLQGAQSSVYKTDIARHNVMLTLGFRF